MEDILSILSAIGIKATQTDIEAILSLRSTEDQITLKKVDVQELRDALAVEESVLMQLQTTADVVREKIGAMKVRSQDSGLPIAGCDHRSKAKATIYFLRQRATVEPVHRAEIAQYVYGDRSDVNLSRLSLVLCALKRKGIVRNGPRGYWFPV
jgi:hypothetical protein